MGRSWYGVRRPRGTAPAHQYPWRSVVGNGVAPIGRDLVGQPETVRTDLLDCGHDLLSKKVHRHWDNANSQPPMYVDSKRRRCTKCPKESRG